VGLARLAESKEIPYFQIMIHSRLSSKAQTTLPKPVRTALGLKEGDLLSYEIEDGRVVLTRAKPSADPFDNPFALFTEWADELDAVYDRL
jgi:antitoxin PrlF